MPQFIYRVTVRGEFADLAPEVRARLVAEQPDHDIFLSSYTPTGTLTYEPAVHAFSYRFELREMVDDDVPESACAESVSARAESLAVDDLDRRGAGYKRLRVNAVNMADMWKDGRR